MFIEMPHKKMKYVGKITFTGECECGHKHKFKNDEIDFEQQEFQTLFLQEIYTCSTCGETYDGLYYPVKNSMLNANVREIISYFIKAAIVFALLFGGMKIISILLEPEPTKNIEDMTNKELMDFLKWKQEQEQIEWENSPAFNNGE